jgi:hypothetical protein
MRTPCGGRRLEQRRPPQDQEVADGLGEAVPFGAGARRSSTEVAVAVPPATVARTITLSPTAMSEAFPSRPYLVLLVRT